MLCFPSLARMARKAMCSLAGNSAFTGEAGFAVCVGRVVCVYWGKGMCELRAVPGTQACRHCCFPCEVLITSRMGPDAKLEMPAVR